MNIYNKLFIKKITLKKEMINDFNKYPFNIEVIKNLDSITLNAPVTFLIGENGTGKSTLIEAIAINVGLNAEGGTQNFNFSTNDTTSPLFKYIQISRTNYPKTKFFYRGRTFNKGR